MSWILAVWLRRIGGRCRCTASLGPDPSCPWSMGPGTPSPPSVAAVRLDLRAVAGHVGVVEPAQGKGILWGCGHAWPVAIHLRAVLVRLAARAAPRKCELDVPPGVAVSGVRDPPWVAAIRHPAARSWRDFCSKAACLVFSSSRPERPIH
ncbi:hypothetical protein D779_0133 [Imhoffiella purpurea]|uniref:Uncharacterized protein n=1 Tax=Imhoffiella purpurea TaxID=1249627 RepID=W9VKC3_9GAMM|nr:hypothetical protein D779_0133 [Imhoffiella purpurea]